jgi:hypothetical protein
MTEAKLSQLYSFAAEEIHKLTTELYESLHTDKGDPEKNWETTLEEVRKYKKLVLIELEGIKTALKEFNEQC